MLLKLIQIDNDQLMFNYIILFISHF